MKSPIISHTMSLTHVSHGRDTISESTKAIAKRGVHGTPGALNFLGKSGCLYLNTITPIEVSIKANIVPIFTSSAIMLIVKNTYY